MVQHNLLDITTVPIKVEINITKGSFTNPRVNNPDKAFKMDIQTNNGKLQIHSEPQKIKIDTYAARSSMGYGQYNNADLIKTEAEKGIKLAYEGTARIASEGNQLARGASPAEIAAQNSRAGQTIQTIMEFLPKTGADITFEDGVLNINYDAGDVNIDWENAAAMPYEFTPGKVEFTIAQMPSVEIEYTGGPIYVPASSAPDYEPALDTRG
ncbi:MAG: hypothetical protein IJ385_04205 [Ruminiclostridium sp.]|nr:hypothetical protein [Ruminiclostridium sp.]